MLFYNKTSMQMLVLIQKALETPMTRKKFKPMCVLTQIMH